ncbi:MAG: hypothetical protein R3F11_32610 [Verrucomicrobiales bacterium]
MLPGENVLALHGLNRGATSSDFLIQPQFVAADNRGPYAAWAIDAHGLLRLRRARRCRSRRRRRDQCRLSSAFGGNPKFLADAEALAPALDRQPDGSIRPPIAAGFAGVADGVFAADDLNAWQRATGVSTISVLPAGDGETEIVTLRILSLRRIRLRGGDVLVGFPIVARQLLKLPYANEFAQIW